MTNKIDKNKMDKIEVKHIYERALKFLGFHISDESCIVLCNSKNEHVWGIDEKNHYLNDCRFKEDSISIEKKIFNIIQKPKCFCVFNTCKKDNLKAKDGDVVWNPFWRCSLEEMAIKLDLLSDEDRK